MSLTTPTDIRLCPDSGRVIVRAFIPADRESLRRIIDRALALSEGEVEERLAELHAQFDARHGRIQRSWEHHFEQLRHLVPQDPNLPPKLRLYIGALFSGEFAVESAALFNPSVVPHPDQSGLASGELRFIMSLRATGEGHISSIAFVTGLITADHQVQLDPRSARVSAPDLNPDPTFRRSSFLRKLHEMEFTPPWLEGLTQALGETFTRRELEEAVETIAGASRLSARNSRRAIESIRWLATINYEVTFDPATTLSQRIIFPNSPIESNGIEDARFVRFTDEDGTITYYATYTAYNGQAILPQLLETQDFLSFRSSSLNGSSARNKGMSLFPRRINGQYAMISRQDDENLYLMYSGDPHLWENARLLRRPSESWEAVKIGNCGSPIETAAGWLLLTHGVGPMRRYCIGAMLLDLDDPSVVLAHLASPLIEPDESLRNGYVPNVVYTCGALVHGSRLIIPYGLSDTSTTLSSIDLDVLLDSMLSPVT